MPSVLLDALLRGTRSGPKPAARMSRWGGARAVGSPPKHQLWATGCDTHHLHHTHTHTDPRTWAHMRGEPAHSLLAPRIRALSRAWLAAWSPAAGRGRSRPGAETGNRCIALACGNALAEGTCTSTVKCRPLPGTGFAPVAMWSRSAASACSRRTDRTEQVWVVRAHGCQERTELAALASPFVLGCHHALP